MLKLLTHLLNYFSRYQLEKEMRNSCLAGKPNYGCSESLTRFDDYDMSVPGCLRCAEAASQKQTNYIGLTVCENDNKRKISEISDPITNTVFLNKRNGTRFVAN